MALSRKLLKRTLVVFLSVFLIMNLIAYFHASKFTHFDNSIKIKTKGARQLSLGQKIKVLFCGINNPRPANGPKPDRKFETLKLKSNKEIECWLIKADDSKGTVILFHGYSGEKSSMLDKAEVFLKEGYSTMLVDFMGAGGSEGNQTTIGFYEAEEVKTAFDHLSRTGEKNIILFGTSMGAAAIMKAQCDFQLTVNSIILECPFGTMLETVEARFKTMHVPAFPMANLLVFWGGFQNNFNAFKHNPVEYAKNIKCPVLLLYGLKDEEVSKYEIEKILRNFKGRKELKTFPLSGHENYLKKYKKEWTKNIVQFLNGESRLSQ